jgi:hypothetical protein
MNIRDLYEGLEVTDAHGKVIGRLTNARQTDTGDVRADIVLVAQSPLGDEGGLSPDEIDSLEAAVDRQVDQGFAEAIPLLDAHIESVCKEKGIAIGRRGTEREGRWWEFRGCKSMCRVLATYDLWRSKKPEEVFRLLTKYIDDWEWCERESRSMKEAYRGET